MKNLNFSTGLEEYSLNDRVTVKFNPTDAVFLERLADLFQKLDALQEEVSALQESTPEEVSRSKLTPSLAPLVSGEVISNLTDSERPATEASVTGL